MKRILALALAFSLLLCGCGTKAVKPEPTLEPVSLDALIEANGRTPATEGTEAVEETQEPTTEPTEPPVYRNPLNGQIVDEPFTGRIHAHTISNMRENMPHVNLVKADVVMEMYVNMNNVIRCLALYSDFASVEAVGSTRSTRPIFNDIAQHYSLIVSHAGGSDTALNDANDRGLEHLNIEDWNVMKEIETSYRDKEYKRSLENSLFGIGANIMAYAESQGWPTTLEKDYGFRFADNGTPAEGEAANQIFLTLTYREAKKDTQFVYDSELSKYVWHQYGQEMTDQITGEKEAFTNVIIMDTLISNNGIYHAADFTGGGTGYYANGGVITPIFWTCEDESEAFQFWNNDGGRLEMGVGNTYIAIVPNGSPVSWEA